MTKEQLKQLEDTLWATADNLRANSDLKASEYSTPVLGIIFLKFADNKYKQFEDEIKAEYEKLKGTRRDKTLSVIAVEKCGFYLPNHARYDYLLNKPDEEDFPKLIKKAMKAIEEYKPELRGVLPKDEYFPLIRTDSTLPKQLLINFSNIPQDAAGDLFGHIYEYFLGKFALAEGQGGGTFFTPRSVVRLMVEIIEPHDGTVFDPACGSGGMFVQSGRFVERRKNGKAADKSSLFVYGQEKTFDYVKLSKMNIAVNGLRGDIQQANTYYEDPFNSFEKYDFVLANPPFNVDDVSLKRVENDKRFNTYGIPRKKTKAKKKDAGKETISNANYLWINLFATSLKPEGRAALVMANSASDARHSEADIRKTLIEKNLIYGMLTLPSNMFYTVTLPATLWFFDKAKKDDKILFIDARNIFTQIDRAHREFNEEQIQNISLISRLHKGDRKSSVELIHSYFDKGITKLEENNEKLKEISKTLIELLKESKDNNLPDFASRLDEIKVLVKAHNSYTTQFKLDDFDKANNQQHELVEKFTPFFKSIHEMLKKIDKRVRDYEKDAGNTKELKNIKEELNLLHQGIKDTEYFFIHINWLQERFPKAEYEDVTGLCKLASMDEIKEQDYSLNPGRYVGVVIEEDGKTEEEFINEIASLKDKLKKIDKETKELEKVINHNIGKIILE
ncbi:N-6 DNA methylase [Bacteroidota bacterium]